MILTSKRQAKHEFAGQNTPHLTLLSCPLRLLTGLFSFSKIAEPVLGLPRSIKKLAKYTKQHLCYGKEVE